MSEHQSPELYVALGRLEEGMRSVRESQERMEKKLDAQDNRINEIELDVKELKTQRTNKSNTFAIWLAIAAIIVSLLTSFLP
jgi:septal ring factor EnvC (AmiA/AmiB activator)